MLINVSRYTDVQNKIQNLVEDWLLEVKSDIEEYGMLDISQTANIKHFQHLKDVWERYGFE